MDGVPTAAANDFTLAEIRTLRAVQATPAVRGCHNGLFIPTLDGVIALAKSEARLGHYGGHLPGDQTPAFRRRGALA